MTGLPPHPLYPQVLRIVVTKGPGRASRQRVPPVLATDIRRTGSDELAGAVVRAIALVEQPPEVEGQPPMLTLRELAEDQDGGEPVITLVEPQGTGAEHVTRWRTVATRFEDTTTFFPTLHRPEISRLMYHCHILEHEDRDMMRPFVVMPTALMPFMDIRASRGDIVDMTDMTDTTRKA